MPETSVIIRCSKCGTKNRVPSDRIDQKPVCGRCKAPLPEQSFFDQPVEITDNTFNSEVMSFSSPVLVDCWAPWCGPCRMVAPILEQIAKEYAGKIKISKLNIDENPKTASEYSIQSIPTMLFFSEGKLVDKVIGAIPKAEIEKRLQQFL